MNRKDFIKGSCGVCIALNSGFVLSALLDSCKTPLDVVKTTSKDDKFIVPVKEFETSGYKLVKLSNYDFNVAIQKESDGSYTALLLKCTHAGRPIAKTGDTYYCQYHGSRFDHEGKVTNGPAAKDLTKLKTVVEKENVVVYLKVA